MQLSVIICTHNRADTLDICLSSIDKVKFNKDNIEFIVIDNNSKDHTSKIVNKYSFVSYYLETIEGLSYARNRGITEAKSDWLLFLDDDCKVKPNIFEIALNSISRNEFKIITGIFKAWYLETPPKWLPYSIGNYVMDQPLKDIKELKDNFISGNVMMIHKPTFVENTNGFPTHLGMKGSKTGYGEETYIEYIYRKKGIPMGINPNMIIYHQVLPFKYKISWILNSAFEKGKARNGERISYLRFFLSLFKNSLLIAGCFIKYIFTFSKNSFIRCLIHYLSIISFNLGNRFFYEKSVGSNY